MATSVAETEIATKPEPVIGRRFAHGREYTTGVEEELMLLDAESLALAQAIEPVLVEAGGRGPLKAELMQCQVETRPVPAGTRRRCSGSSPRCAANSSPMPPRAASALPPPVPPVLPLEEQQITARDRYRELVAALRYPARRVVVFGMHVHVAIGARPRDCR